MTAFDHTDVVRLPERVQVFDNECLVLDAVVRPEFARQAGREFPDWKDGRWHTFDFPAELGKQEGQYTIAGPRTAAIVQALNSPECVAWMRNASGIPDLMADPDLTGAGIHQCAPGGRLDLHTDFNMHPSRDWVRALNVIVFCTDAREWNPAWGGMFEINALTVRFHSAVADTMECPHGVAQVMPLPGTMVVFRADNPRMFHGHPKTLAPTAPRRRSIPAYYYRPIRDRENIEVHSTRWKNDT
jgi:hypothetical protein